jgi:hypothetical protein
MDDLAAIRAAAGVASGGGPAKEDVPFPPPPAEAPAAPASRAASAPVQPAWRTHDVFDRMGMATTFDVGNVSLVRRFQDLDAELDREAASAASRAYARSTAPPRGVDDVLLAQDLAMLHATMGRQLSHTHPSGAAAGPVGSVDARVAATPAAVVTPPTPIGVPVAVPVAVPVGVPMAPNVVPTPPPVAAPISSVPTVPTEVALSPANGGRVIDERSLAAGDILLASGPCSPAYPSPAPLASAPLAAAASAAAVRRSMLYLGNGEIAEGTASGVSIRPLAEALAGSEVVVAARVPEATDTQRAAAVAYAREQRATPYAREGVVRQGTFRLEPALHCAQKPAEERERCLRWTGRVLLTAGDDPDFCVAQLVVDAYAFAGVPLTALPPGWDGPLPYVDLVLARPLAYVGHLKAPLLR